MNTSNFQSISNFFNHVSKYNSNTSSYAANRQLNLNLPTPMFDTIPSIKRIFASVCQHPGGPSAGGGHLRREKLGNIIKSKDYIKKLIDCFREAEKTNNLPILYDISAILRYIFNLNMIGIFEILFSTDILMDVLGMLEYLEPTNPSGARNDPNQTIDTEC